MVPQTEDRKLQLPVRGAVCTEGCGSAVTTGTQACRALFGNQLPCLVARRVCEPDWCPVPTHQEVALAPEQMVSWGLLCSERLTLDSPDPPAQRLALREHHTSFARGALGALPIRSRLLRCPHGRAGHSHRPSRSARSSWAEGDSTLPLTQSLPQGPPGCAHSQG